MIFSSLQQMLTTRSCTSSAALNTDPSLVLCVHVFMSLMWFFYPRASSGILSQESKCGTPVTALSSPICLCESACMHVYVRTQILYVEEHNPLKGLAHLCMHECPLHDALCTNSELSPHSQGLLLQKKCEAFFSEGE